MLDKCHQFFNKDTQKKNETIKTKANKNVRWGAI